MQDKKDNKENVQSKKGRKGKKSQEPQKITIELYKYKTLVEALGDRAKVLRVIFTIFFLGVLLFAGITVITLAIKRLYPYSDITTNGLGATTIKSEKNEVSYWLFNTATVWANSGITVKKGDIITIRASGKSHTAIHHLYDAAKFNVTKRNEWVGSEGELDIEAIDSSTYARRRFRIFPNMPSGALLMQVVQGSTYDNTNDGDSDNFYFIGKERQHIYINNNGTLSFAVNDIILNQPTIAAMMWDCIKEKRSNGDPATKKTIDDLIVKKGLVSVNQDFNYLELVNQKDNIKSVFDCVFKQESLDTNQLIGKMHLGHTFLPKDSIYTCELSYYYGSSEQENKARKNVWFDDNIGSFLIVVEKTN